MDYSFAEARLNDYLIESCLGKGAFGKVYKARDLQKGGFVAVKHYSINKDSDNKLELYIQNQIDVMTGKSHPNLVFLKKHIKNPDGVFLILEYCNKGDLKAFIEEKKYISEEEAAGILRQLVKGFEYLYRLGLMHRDLKSKNILIHEEPGGALTFKIGDFDFIKHGKGETFAGSKLYMAPEVIENGLKEIIKESYTNKIDIWGLGVVYYEMLFGEVPFKGPKNSNPPAIQLKTIKENENKINFDLNKINISAESKDFIKRCLIVDKTKRISWLEIFKHPLIIGKKLVRCSYEKLKPQALFSNNLSKEFPEEEEEEEKEENGWILVVQDQRKKSYIENMPQTSEKKCLFFC